MREGRNHAVASRSRQGDDRGPPGGRLRQSPRRAVAARRFVPASTLARRQPAGDRPETWTHGSSAQRKQWFTEGFEVRSCDTFGASI
ncbi:MAG TPA: neutral zinc metallopeptidase [Actinomycetota bacterium]